MAQYFKVLTVYFLTFSCRYCYRYYLYQYLCSTTDTNTLFFTPIQLIPGIGIGASLLVSSKWVRRHQIYFWLWLHLNTFIDFNLSLLIKESPDLLLACTPPEHLYFNLNLLIQESPDLLSTLDSTWALLDFNLSLLIKESPDLVLTRTPPEHP